MTKFYLLLPCLLLGLFALYHHSAAERVREKENAHAADLAAKKQALDERREALQHAAFEQAQIQAATREQQEHARVDRKRRDYEALLAKIESEADTHATEAERLAGEKDRVARELGELRARRTVAQREIAEASRRVELRQIERRDAELEAQRVETQVLARFEETVAAQPRF